VTRTHHCQLAFTDLFYIAQDPRRLELTCRNMRDLFMDAVHEAFRATFPGETEDTIKTVITEAGTQAMAAAVELPLGARRLNFRRAVINTLGKKLPHFDISKFLIVEVVPADTVRPVAAFV